jgi:hypothetical protein
MGNLDVERKGYKKRERESRDEIHEMHSRTQLLKPYNKLTYFRRTWSRHIRKEIVKNSCVMSAGWKTLDTQNKSSSIDLPEDEEKEEEEDLDDN